MRAESQQVHDGGLKLLERPAGRGSDDRVVASLPATGPCQQLGGERCVATGQPTLPKQRGHREVGIGPVAVHGPQRVKGRPSGPIRTTPSLTARGVGTAHSSSIRRAPSFGSASKATPRAQSAAAIGFLPWACTSPSSRARVPVPTCTDRFVISSAPGEKTRLGKPRRVDLEPITVEGGPGPRCRITAANQPIDDLGRLAPIDLSILHGDLGRVAHLSISLRLWGRGKRAVLDPVDECQRAVGHR